MSDNSFSVRIRGIVVAGIGQAGRHLPAQSTFLFPQFPELSGCHKATINVLIEKPIAFTRNDFVGHQPNPPGVIRVDGESYGFIRVRFSFRGGRDVTAFIYRPSESPNRFNPHLVEILAPFIDGVRPGATCTIAIESAFDEGFAFVV